MRRIRLAALALAAALLLGLAGCAGNTVKVTVWRRGESAVALQETRKLQSGTELISGMIAAFNSGPEEPGLSRAAPEGADILGWRLDGAELKLEVSQGWAELEGYDRTIAECCAVLTFCSVEGIDRVSFCLLGQKLGPAMDEDDVILSAYTGAE